MTRAERAAYMVSLVSLMESQEDSGVHDRSKILGDEYNKNWDILIGQIKDDRDERTDRRTESSVEGAKDNS